MHGYESVVGPVKGVYTKENAMTKAREHALLVSTRPSFVTILTLGKWLVNGEKILFFANFTMLRNIYYHFDNLLHENHT